MKRKVIASLVAAALGLSASSAALAIPGGCPADGATPFTAGPVNPVNGFAEFVDDGNQKLELCLAGDGATGACFFDPPIAGNLFSQQIGFGPEAFWWLAEGSIDGNVNALVVMAAEAAFATENPAPLEQFPFTRLRIRLDVPVPGTYVVTHPYGQSTYVVDTVGAGDEVRESFDVQFAPGASGQQGRVGPWLQSVDDLANPLPAGFIGDGQPRPATGSPCGTNYFKVEAFDTLTGAPLTIDPGDSDNDGEGAGTNSFTQDLFGVFGKLWDGVYSTPLTADRTSYDRPAANGQVDSFATSVAQPGAGGAGNAVTVSGGANLPAGELGLTGPDNFGRFYRSEVLGDATTLPPIVAVTGTGESTDPTRLLRALTDVVNVSKAEYNVETGLLSVMATSSDVAANPVLTVAEYGATVGPLGVGIPTSAPPARVTVVSAKGGSHSAPVTVVAAAAGANQPPTAIPDDASTLEDTAVVIDVLANDSDPDGNPLTVFDVSNVQNGTAVSNGTTITFTPSPNFFGEATFEYRVTDNLAGGLSQPATVTVNVLPVNDNPVANPDPAVAGDARFITLEDAALVIPGAFLTENDTDVDSTTLTVSAVGGAVNGLVALNGTDVVFTPATNFSGPASFTYTVSDGSGGSASALVSITVLAQNDAPVARDDVAATAFETAVLINVLGNDSDPEGSALTVESVTTPANGTVTNNGTSITYTPATGFSGTDSFTYRVQDTGGAVSNSATVQVSVAAPAAQVDLDINRLNVTGTVRLNRNQAVGITLRVTNGGTVNGSRPATVVGTMNGVEVYRQSVQVSDPVGGGATNFTFPSFTPTIRGTINWRAEIFDDNPDVDVATATTTVQ